MAETVGEFLLARLTQWGVKRIYGEPGDGTSGVIDALGRGEAGIEFVPARNEELAAFMACAHAKWSGEVGVCVAASEPGAIHLLGGLYDAKLDHQPVLALVVQPHRSASVACDAEEEVDLPALFKDVAHEFVEVASEPEALGELLDRAMRVARDRRSVACLILPHGLQDRPAPETAPPPPGTLAPDTTDGTPAEDELQRAADVLNAGRKVAMLVGAGALHATDELIEVAERLGAGVAKALLGKAAVPDDLPYVTGSIGLLGSRPSGELMEQCDTLLVVGSGFPYAEFLPEVGQARGVQIDIDAKRLAAPRYPMEVSLLGDSRATLRALLPHLEAKADTSFRERIEREVARWWQVLEARAMDDAEPINPQRVFRELSSRLPEHCIVTCDAGTCANWFARDVKLRRGMSASLSGGLASMGSAVPYAIAAKLVEPERPVVALLGDGAMQLNGINALVTIAASWRQWRDPRLVVMVLNDGDLADFPYAAYADLIGLRGLRVDHPEAVGPAWAAALNSDVPTVLEMVTDPRVPPLPWATARAWRVDPVGAGRH